MSENIGYKVWLIFSSRELAHARAYIYKYKCPQRYEKNVIVITLSLAFLCLYWSNGRESRADGVAAQLYFVLLGLGY